MGKLLKHKFSAKKTEDNSNENIENIKKEKKPGKLKFKLPKKSKSDKAEQTVTESVKKKSKIRINAFK